MVGRSSNIAKAADRTNIEHQCKTSSQCMAQTVTLHFSHAGQMIRPP